MDNLRESKVIAPNFGGYSNQNWSTLNIVEKDLELTQDQITNNYNLYEYSSYIDGKLNINYNKDNNYNDKLNLEGSNVKMDENKMLEKYMDKMDQDRRDQEERLSKNMQLMEQRIVEERRLSEDRIEKKFNETMEALKATNNKIEKLEDKLDNKTNMMLEKIDSTNKWIIATCLATILGIAGVAASAIWGGLIK
ncbi:hypothetical protein [Clostridium sp. HMSC19A10]|uniref:hypothetical protein n=1 Tax=Clostridium sp. HMSC19A10 TaxID=1581148 RepID=UPI0008A2CF5D|nr:hypothetical protein [Clostridium sp. HMSC19A10]OFS22976.1 hypothetical protein HMPREF3070_09470 [Clostridium sp. HMSC19A10]